MNRTDAETAGHAVPDNAVRAPENAGPAVLEANEHPGAGAAPGKMLAPRFPAATSVKIIGLGGVGSIVADYAALWLNAQSLAHPEVNFRLVLIDGDDFEIDNARMHFRRCGNKAAVKCEELIERLGERLQRLTLSAVEEFVKPDNAARLIHEADRVLLCVDSHASRKLVSDHFRTRIRDGVLISAGNDGVGPERPSGRTLRGTFGNCQIHVRRAGADVTPPLTRYHPEIEHPSDRLPGDEACTDLIASVPQLLMTNVWAAASMLSTLYLSFCWHEKPGYSELVFDIAEARLQPVELSDGDAGR